MRSPSSRSGRLSVAVACLVVAAAVPSVLAAGVGEGPTAVGGPSGGSACQPPAVPALERGGDGAGNLSIETLVAPGSTYGRLTNASALATARENGSLTPAERGVDRTYDERVVAYRDVVVHRVELSGSATDLLDRLTAGNRSPTANFRALLARGTVGFEYRGASACPPRLAVNATLDRGAIRVVPDGADDAVSFVLDLDRLLFYPLDGGEPTTDARVHGHHGFGVTLRPSGGLVPETATVGQDYEVERAGAGLDGPHEGLVRVDPGANRTVAGRTLLAPGSEVTVVAHPYAADTPPIAATATVDRSREFAVAFDLSNASRGDVYVVEFEGIADPTPADGEATFVAVGNASGAIVGLRNQTTTGRILYGPALTTTHGGFVVVRNASGGVVGVSEYREPGTAVAQVELSPRLGRNQTVTATVYRDADGDRTFDAPDRPYRLNGSVVRDTALVRLHGDGEPTETPTVTDDATSPTDTGASTTAGDPTTDRDTPADPPTDSTTTGTTLPGFGALLALVTVVVAVAVAAAIAARRR